MRCRLQGRLKCFNAYRPLDPSAAATAVRSCSSLVVKDPDRPEPDRASEERCRADVDDDADDCRLWLELARD